MKSPKKLSGKVCQQCKRGGLTGNIRSHSNIATKRRQQINLQAKKIDGKKMKLCTRCIRTAAKKNKALTA